MVRLDTISEMKSLQLPHPPRGAEKPAITEASWGSGIEDESGDQDPLMNDGGEEYARAYFAIQARKAAAANSVKAANAQPGASGSPDSFSSEQSDAMVFKMPTAIEPLYGDAGEEEHWKAEEGY